MVAVDELPNGREAKRSKFYLMLFAVCGKSGAVCLYKVLRVVS